MRVRPGKTKQATPPAPQRRDPPPSNRPTEQRARQAEAVDNPDVDGVAFRPWWRVRTRLDGLLAAGLIEEAAWLAAGKFRDDAEAALMRLGPSTLARLGLARAPRELHARDLHRVKALERLRRVRDKLGPADYALIWWIAAEDRPWTEVGRRLACTERTAKKRAAAAIGRLAERA